MRTLNVIGCGKVGTTLARLWSDADALAIQDVANRRAESAERACACIGAGRAASLESMRPADIVLIAVPDRSVGAVCRVLVEAGGVRAGDIVFHVSGVLAATELADATAYGARVASVHPVKSFADIRDAVDTFGGTYCAVEGDAEAVTVLSELFRSIGGRPFAIRGEAKTLYHLGSVFACNYLVCLLEVAMRVFEQAGIPRSTAWEALGPLMSGTLANTDRLGTRGALTGPIARGDCDTVARHLHALQHWASQGGDADLAPLYARLGRIALELAHSDGMAETTRDEIGALLDAALSPAPKQRLE